MDSENEKDANERQLVAQFLEELADRSTSPRDSDTGRTNVRCPQCGERIALEDLELINKVQCPACESEFNLLSVAGTETFRGPEPNTLAHFQLLEYLGAGQFGNVWKAKDTQLDRVVALKIPRRAHAHEGDVEAFLREARAAAQLAHPHIVHVFEVGSHEGTTYIASDFIQGSDLKDWLTQRRMTFSEAASLCGLLADALDHAHEHGVVHRDLKPANVMMDLKGLPHIMDFGVAKRDTGEVTITLDGQIVGTPAYMSPEQARGESHRVDGRTDIYSLGVILFELLTGELPFRGAKRMLIVQILSDEPPSPRKLNARIPRDLETICLKCLEKNPERRYESGAALAADLRRWLKNEPIEARPVSRLERAARWCQRHTAVASLLALVVIVTLVGFGLVSWQWRRARTQYLEAEKQKVAVQRQQERGDRYYDKLLEAVDKMLLEVGAERLKDEPRSASMRRTLTEEALAFHVWLADQEAEEEGDQTRLAETLTQIGKLRSWLRDNKPAEEAFRKALRIVEQLKEPEQSDPKNVGLGLTIRFELAELLRDTGRIDDAEEVFNENIRIARAEVAKAPDQPEFSIELGRSLVGSAVTFRADSRPDEADLALSEAIALLGQTEQRPGLNQTQKEDAWKLLALANHWRAIVLGKTPRFKESDPMYREAVRLVELLPRTESENQDLLAAALSDWSIYWHHREDFKRADDLLKRSTELRRTLAKEHPSVPSYRHRMAIVYQNVGYALMMKGQFEKARKSLRESLDALKVLTEDYPDVPDYRESLGNTGNLYAYTLSKTEGDVAAQAAYELARKHYLDLLKLEPDNAQRHSELAAVLNNLSQLHYRNKDYQQSVTASREAITHEEEARKSDMENTQFIRQLQSHYHGLALGLNRLQDRAGALKAYDQTVSLAKQLLKQDPTRGQYRSSLGGTYHNMATVAVAMDDYPRAETLVREAIEQTQLANEQLPDDVNVLTNLRRHNILLIHVLRTTDRSKEAIEVYPKAIALAEQVTDRTKTAKDRDAWISLLCKFARYLADPRRPALQDVPRSVELVEKAKTIDPENRDIPHALGVIEIHKENWDAALKILPPLIDDDQLDDVQRVFAAAYVAKAHAQKGDLEHAREFLGKSKAKAEESDWDKPNADWEQLVQEVEKLLKSDSKSP